VSGYPEPRLSLSAVDQGLLIFVPLVAHSYDCSLRRPPDSTMRFGEIADPPLRHRAWHRFWQLGAYAVGQAVELGTERGREPRAQHGEPVLD
jgi:hypothetical protein